MTILEVRLSIFCFRCSVSLWNSWSGLLWFALFTYWKGIVNTGVPLALWHKCFCLYLFFLLNVSLNPLLFFFHAEADDEISFNPDDIIYNIEMIDEGWWKGQCHGRTGLFPAAYVQLIEWATRSQSLFLHKLHLNKLQYCWTGGGICI